MKNNNYSYLNFLIFLITYLWYILYNYITYKFNFLPINLSFIILLGPIILIKIYLNLMLHYYDNILVFLQKNQFIKSLRMNILNHQGELLYLHP